MTARCAQLGNEDASGLENVVGQERTSLLGFSLFDQDEESTVLALRGSKIIRDLDLSTHVALDIALQTLNFTQKTQPHRGCVNDGMKR